MNYYIKLKETIDSKDYPAIDHLRRLCLDHEPLALKLELEYKLRRAEGKAASLHRINEFMVYDDEQLVGYMGIDDFGGDLEVNGMIHPRYRKKGLFKELFFLVKNEWMRRGSDRLLLLSDRRSSSGQGFIKSINARHSHSEYEMYLRNKPKQELDLSKVVLRKATNADAQTIERLSSICFNDDYDEEKMLIPEEEEKCGLRIYLAVVDNNLIGKIHLDVSSSIAGIYGFGVLPEYRGKGYGRAILTHAIEMLKEGEFKEIMIQVEVKNENALKLYLSCGFEVTSTMDYFEFKERANR